MKDMLIIHIPFILLNPYFYLLLEAFIYQSFASALIPESVYECIDHRENKTKAFQAYSE